MAMEEEKLAVGETKKRGHGRVGRPDKVDKGSGGREFRPLFWVLRGSRSTG